jgi:hypothetical protein
MNDALSAYLFSLLVLNLEEWLIVLLRLLLTCEWVIGVWHACLLCNDSLTSTRVSKARNR